MSGFAALEVLVGHLRISSEVPYIHVVISAALLWVEVVVVDSPRRPHRLKASTHVPTGPEHSSLTLFNHLQSRVLGGHRGGSGFNPVSEQTPGRREARIQKVR